jgi:hypothetical protein
VSAACDVDGCGRQAHAKALCSKHYERWRKHGDPLFVAPILGRPLKGDVPGFHAIHKRLLRSRGPASEFDCVDCGGSAREWSYDGLDPDELIGTAGPGAPVAYSLDLEHYEPRCVSCHRRFDHTGDRQRDAFGRFAAA